MALMRAAHLQENLRAIDGLKHGLREEIRKRIPGVVSTIEMAMRTSWLDAELDVRLTQVLADVVGVGMVRKANHDALVASANGPLLSPLRDGLIKLLGLSPAAAFRWMPRGWGHIYKDFGEVQWDPVTRTLRVLGLPRFALESEGWCEGTVGAVLGVIAVAGGKDPQVEMARHVEQGELWMKVNWRDAL